MAGVGLSWLCSIVWGSLSLLAKSQELHLVAESRARLLTPSCRGSPGNAWFQLSPGSCTQAMGNPVFLLTQALHSQQPRLHSPTSPFWPHQPQLWHRPYTTAQLQLLLCLLLLPYLLPGELQQGQGEELLEAEGAEQFHSGHNSLAWKLCMLAGARAIPGMNLEAQCAALAVVHRAWS